MLGRNEADRVCPKRHTPSITQAQERCSRIKADKGKLKGAEQSRTMQTF